MSDAKPRRRIAPLLGIFLALGIGSVCYKLLVHGHLEQTAALFIGLPLVVAVFILTTIETKTALGAIEMSITLLLLASMMFLGEGFVCVLMASPVFYLIGGFIGVVIDSLRERSASKRAEFLILLPFLAMSFEGADRRVSFSRESIVTVERTIPRDVRDFERSLSAPLHFNKKLPVFFQLGFPVPTGTRGSGLEPGTERLVHFAGGEGKPGDLRVRVESRGERWVVFRVVSDTSHIAHWLHWEQATVEWREAATHETTVRWTLRYRRLLDPAWYFAPLERYGARLASEYLIETVAGGS